MSTALAKASSLKPEIRLAQAVSEFEAALSNEQKSTFRTFRSQSLSAAPSPNDVMRLTAEVDRRISKKFGGQCFGPRFTNFLQGVQQFAALGDIVVGGSQNMIACGVWSLVRMSLLSIISLSTYVDKLSSLFMDIGRSAPRHQAMALLYPRSGRLQASLSEYFIVVVNLCHHLFKFGQKSTVQQLAFSLNDSSLKAFRIELEGWANLIRDELNLNEAQENSGFRALSRKMFKITSYQQKLASSLRVLDYCSTYNHQTTWKQIKKAGSASSFMQHLQYQEWKVRSDPCSLVYAGKLGSGKSVLLATVLDDINLSPEIKGCATAYFFCRHDIAESLQPRTILGSLARQLLCTVPDLSVLFESVEHAGFGGDTEEVLELLVQGFPVGQKAYVVLDGLDECNQEEQNVVLQSLQKLQRRLKILLCLSCRMEPSNTLQSIAQYLASPQIISMPGDNPDIGAFIDAELERCLRLKKLILGDPTLILEIQHALLKGSQGMFLWVALQIQSLCGMKTDSAIREAIADLPQDLSETFRRILLKSGNSDQSLQRRTLQLVIAAFRPLTTEELRDALSVTPGDANWDESKLLNDVWSALSCCGCLLTIDEEESTVHVVHHSVKQYLLAGSNGAKNENLSTAQACRTLADTVVTYLAYGVFDTELSTTRVHPVVVQSAPAKVMHTVSTMGSPSTTLNLALKLLKSRKQPDVDISKTLAEARGPPKRRPVNAFPFHSYAKAYWQYHLFYVSDKDVIILDLSRKLIQSRKPKIQLQSKEYWVHWEWAVQNGNSMIPELLFHTGNVKVNSRVESGGTHLAWAIQNGHKRMVEVLLGTGKTADLGFPEFYTPLVFAVDVRNKEIVELLLSTGKADPNQKIREGLSPLMRAVSLGYTEIVEVLLNTEETDVNVVENGWTPLMRAVANGENGIVELLIKTGKVDVNARNKYGETALDSAISYGQWTTFELLLKTGPVDVEAKFKHGRTPLSYAAEHGYIDLVKLLLDTGKAVVDAKDDHGLTPLDYATQEGYADIVKLLRSHLGST